MLFCVVVHLIISTLNGVGFIIISKRYTRLVTMSHRRSVNFSMPVNSSTPASSRPSPPVFSPLVRRSVGRANRSLAAAAILNESIIRTEEDDDAERRLLFHSLNEGSAQETAESADNMVAGFHRCMQLFADNKITKNNAWDLTLINTMHKLVTSNHECMDDLQVATSTLDASTKIYGLRVDLVHADGVQLASDLRRNQGSKKIQHIQADDDDNDNPPEEVAEPAAGTQPKKKKRKRKSNGFIVQNLDLINGIPDCVEPFDRLFNNRSATRGDCETTEDLFQATLYTDSTKMMHMRSEQYVFFKNCDLQSGGHQPDPATLPIVDVPIALLQRVVVGQSVNPSLIAFSFNLPDDRDMLLSSQLNSSQMDLAFDINAEVQQAPPNLNVSEPFMEFNAENYGAGMEPDHDYDDDEPNPLSRLAQNAVGTVNPRDLLFCLRNTKLEYSYRHTAEKMIMGLWAGPSHWKIKPVRLAGSSVQSKDTNVQESHNKVRHHAAAADEIVDVHKVVDMADFQNLNNKNTKLKPATIAGWDASKNTLPEDLHVEDSMMRSLVRKHVLYKMKSRDDQREPVCVDDSISPYNYDNDNDNEYCSNIVDERNLYADDENVDELPPSGDAPLPENDILAMVDAPFRVDKVTINYATQAKIVDMKKLKKCTWHILQEKLVENVSAVHLASGLGFDELYYLLKAKLDNVQSANLSISLALSALLHLANEHRLDLIQESSDKCDNEIPEIYIKMPADI